jgi:hypothetical protein
MSAKFGETIAPKPTAQKLGDQWASTQKESKAVTALSVDEIMEIFKSSIRQQIRINGGIPVACIRLYDFIKSGVDRDIDAIDTALTQWAAQENLQFKKLYKTWNIVWVFSPKGSLVDADAESSKFPHAEILKFPPFKPC